MAPRISWHRTGMAAVDYVGAVLAVAAVFAGLVVLRDHTVGRRPPVRTLPAIVRLLGEPLRVLDPRPPRAHPSRPGHPRPHPPRRPPPVVRLPDWFVHP